MAGFTILILLFGLCTEVRCDDRFVTSADSSLYALPIKAVDQQGKNRLLSMHKGRAVIVTMFYGNCPYACPLLIESIRATENALSPKAREGVRVLMITIDPNRDTPPMLAKLAAQRHLDTRRWTMANVNEDDVRLLAALLGVQYRKLPNGEYNHTSILTLLSHSGAIVKQTQLLGKADPEMVAEIEKAVAMANSPSMTE